MRTIWKSIAVPLMAAVCGTSAHACQPAYRHTEYFGERTYLSEEVRDKVLDDIRANHYTVIEPQIGLLFYPIVRKGDAIYLGNQPIATEKDSFWYLGHGYYQLNGQLYYMGERVGAYPGGGTVVVHVEDRTRPGRTTIRRGDCIAASSITPASSKPRPASGSSESSTTTESGGELTRPGAFAAHDRQTLSDQWLGVVNGRLSTSLPTQSVEKPCVVRRPRVRPAAESAP